MQTARFLQSDSIATQLIKIVFGLYCVVAVIVTATQIVIEYQYTENQIKNELAINQHIFAPVLSIGLWNLDDEQIQNTINGMLAIPIITGVSIVQDNQLYTATGTIIDLNGNTVTFDSSGKPIDSPPSNQAELFAYQFAIEYDFRGELKQVGQATIFSDSQVVFNRVEMGFILLIINSIIKTIALWILFFYVGKRILLKPLSKLVEAINNVNFKQLDQFEIDLQNKAQNELTIIQHAFTQMVENLNTAKQEILQLNNSLEDKVAKRTFDLKMAKEEAELANQAKSIFMSRINHELRTPLNAIIGCSQIIQNNLEHHPTLKQPNDMVIHTIDAAEHLLMLFEDIMDVVILSGKEVSIQLQSYALDPIIHASIAMTFVQAQAKQVTVNYQDCQLSVYANDGRLKQVMINLITNAIKYNHQNGRIDISAATNNHQQVQIHVKDTGIGIATADQQRIFEPLSRLEYAENNCIEGTGIGLSIVYNLVTKMHGNIVVNSQMGQGSEFIVTLPTQKPPA